MFSAPLALELGVGSWKFCAFGALGLGVEASLALGVGWRLWR